MEAILDTIFRFGCEVGERKGWRNGGLRELVIFSHGSDLNMF